MKILYFARIRQIAGKASDDVEVPPTVTTIRELIDYLGARDGNVAAALGEPRLIRAAIDHSHVPLDAAIAGAKEIAFFPPVTGG